MLRSSLVLVIGAALASACGGAGGEAREPGEVAAQYQGPIQSSDVARGEERYNGLCMSCHGSDAPALEAIAWEADAMRQQIREGGGRMPAILESWLSSPDLEAVLAFMTTNGGVTGELPGAGGEPTEDGEVSEEPPAQARHQDTRPREACARAMDSAHQLATARQLAREAHECLANAGCPNAVIDGYRNVDGVRRFSEEFWPESCRQSCGHIVERRRTESARGFDLSRGSRELRIDVPGRASVLRMVTAGYSVDECTARLSECVTNQPDYSIADCLNDVWRQAREDRAAAESAARGSVERLLTERAHERERCMSDAECATRLEAAERCRNSCGPGRLEYDSYLRRCEARAPGSPVCENNARVMCQENHCPSSPI